MKFGRTYSLYVQGRTDNYTLSDPLTCRFQVVNDNLATTGSATFLLYNLTKKVRDDIYADLFAPIAYRQVVFSAGYKSILNNGAPILTAIFKGNVVLAYSYRQGPDWITEIQAQDGAWALDTSSINETVPRNYRFGDVLSKLVFSMKPTLSIGVLSGSLDFIGSQQRGITLCGNPWDILVRSVLPKSLTAYIYQERVFVVTQNEYINLQGGVDQISDETGLLDSPKLQEGIVTCRMIFEPRLEVQQKVELKTISDPALSRMNGPFTVSRVIHRGTISGATCENLITEVTLYRPNTDLVEAA